MGWWIRNWIRFVDYAIDTSISHPKLCVLCIDPGKFSLVLQIPALLYFRCFLIVLFSGVEFQSMGKIRIMSIFDWWILGLACSWLISHDDNTQAPLLSPQIVHLRDYN